MARLGDTKIISIGRGLGEISWPGVCQPSYSLMTSEPRTVPSSIASIVCGGLVSFPVTMAISRLYILVAEFACRWFPESWFSRTVNLLWFGPGMRGDILLLSLTILSVHFVVYANLFRTRPRSFHLKYLTIGTGCSVAIVVIATLVFRSLGQLHSPL